MNKEVSYKTAHQDTTGVYADLRVTRKTDSAMSFSFSIPGIASGNVEFSIQSKMSKIVYTSGAESTVTDVAVSDALIAALAQEGML